MLISLIRAPRWMLVCPRCGRQAAALHPPPGSERPLVRAALEAEWAGRNARGEVDLPDILGDPFGWVCQQCRTGKKGSMASQLSPIDRLARAATKADDSRRGQRRPGESWAQEARRERRIAEALRMLTSMDFGAASRLGAFLEC